MRGSALLVLLAIPCFAGEMGRPPCNARNRGQLWPQEANSDRNAARRAEHAGQLEMCTPGVWKYHWQPLTVHISQLGKSPRHAIKGRAEANVKATKQ